MPDRPALDFAAWLARHFPGRGGPVRAAEYLGKSRRSVDRMARGEQPVTGPTARKCEELVRQTGELVQRNPELMEQE